MQLSKPMMAFYCSKECLMASWPLHKRFHAAFGPQDDAVKSINQTTVLAFLELKARGRLPEIAPTGTVRILFAGASARHEEMLNGPHLLQLLREFCYPNMGALHVDLCGPQMQAAGTRSVSPEVTITSTISTIQAAFPSATSLASSFQLCMVIAPGYTDLLDNWDPAMTLLVASGLPLCVTSYSSFRALDNDALFDQECVEVYWRANIVVGSQINQCCVPFATGALGHKSRYYTIAQGLKADAQAVDKRTFKRGMTANYLRFQANYYRVRDAHFADRCESIAADLDAGTLPYAEKGMSHYVGMAQQY